MSWSIHIPETTPQHYTVAAREAREAQAGPFSAEEIEQIDAAMEVAEALVKSKTVAPTATKHRVAVTLIGHANPDHHPRAGVINDTITVTVSQTGADNPPNED